MGNEYSYSGCGQSENHSGADIMGIRSCYQGLVNGMIHPLTLADVEHISNKAGTICKNLWRTQGEERRFSLMGIWHKCSCGYRREGFLKGAQKLYRLGVKVAGIPCTDDHDLPYTDTRLI
ncbi:6-phosphofructokinase [Bacillus spizizenii]|uniref:6-phosphofructokinase n=1 Tax=Bacillus spizizenii TaxID=96241 RepID=UPI003D22DF6C